MVPGNVYPLSVLRRSVWSLALLVAPAANAEPAPTITSVTTAYGPATIATNTWIAIKGTNLVPATTPAGGMSWSNAPEFASGRMPTSLGAVSVTVAGLPAYIYWFCSAKTTHACSSDQINVLTPLDPITGQAPVVVFNSGLASNTFVVQKNALSPSFLMFDAAGHIVATHANFSLIGPTTLYPGASTPAQAGETIALFGVGFGLPQTNIVPGSATQSGALPLLPYCELDLNTQLPTKSANLISPGLYQINVQVPVGISSGDHEVDCTYFSNYRTNVGLLNVGANGGAAPLQGRSFSITASTTLSGKPVTLEIQAGANNNGVYTLVVDDNLSAGSAVQFVFSMNATPTLSAGIVAAFSGFTSSGFYLDTSNPLQPVSSPIGSASLIISFPSTNPTAGATVSGSLAFNLNDNVTVQGTFTGTLTAIH